VTGREVTHYVIVDVFDSSDAEHGPEGYDGRHERQRRYPRDQLMIATNDNQPHRVRVDRTMPTVPTGSTARPVLPSPLWGGAVEDQGSPKGWGGHRKKFVGHMFKFFQLKATHNH